MISFNREESFLLRAIRVTRPNTRVPRKEICTSGLTSLGTIIGKDARVGVNVNFMPGVKIGNGAGVFPGANVFKDIPDLETFRG